jgi:hypothetical protein
MTTGSRASLEELLEAVSRDELARLVARRGRVSMEVFLEALHADFDDAIERLEAAARHYVNDGVEKLTGFLTAQLAAAGYDATCEADGRERAGLKVENRAATITWFAEAELYRDYADERAGILRLFGWTSGRHGHAGFVSYIRQIDAAQIIERRRRALELDPQINCHGVIDSQSACVFTSKHTHPASQLPIAIRHHAVVLEHARLRDEDRSRRHVILFLTANPSGTAPRTLDRQARAIQVELERGGCRDRFELVTRWAAEPLDLLRELRRLRPTVVHFSGHGTPSAAEPAGLPGAVAAAGSPGPATAGSNIPGAPGEDGGDPWQGLFFQTSAGGARLVPTLALAEAFGVAGASVKLVVLDACHSKPQAESLLDHVDCVVGMTGAIADETAMAFARGFYGSLADRASVADAYKQGCAAISLEGVPGGARPQLLVREGVDAGELVLAADS